VERALSIAESSDLICATGSLFLVAEVMQYMLKRA
jgi:folylpolyglutamate synthase/dihydropteroate synthase